MVVINIRSKIYRLVWRIVYHLIFKNIPIPFFKLRTLLLKLFGSDIDWSAEIYPNCDIWSPCNLQIGENSGIGPACYIYNVDKIVIGKNVNISQRVTLCTATRDYRSSFELITKPIFICDNAWIGMEAFIGLGVRIGCRSIIGARSCVMKNTNDDMIAIGNPAIYKVQKK